MVMPAILKGSMIRLFGTLFVGLCGLCFGSFLNVCLSRWPEEESVVLPGSHCRHCSHVLSWWENIPLLSWLLLRGRCCECRTWIGWRYPLVEAAVGGLWAWTGFRLFHFIQNCLYFLIQPLPSQIAPFALHSVGYLIFLWIMVALLMLDAEHFWLPDRLTLGGILPGFLVYVGYYLLDMQWDYRQPGAISSLVTMILLWIGQVVVAAGALWLIRWIYEKLRHREGIGMGDVKLMALLAAWLGLPQTLLAFVIAVFVGSLVAGVFLLKNKNGEEMASMKMPLGTFLCLGGIISCLWGEPLTRFYQHWAGF